MRTLKASTKVKNFLLAQSEYLVSPVLCFLWGIFDHPALLFLAVFIAEKKALDIYFEWKESSEELGKLLDELEEAEKENDI